jgi:hypothetical protein
VDQLERTNGLTADRIAAVRRDLSGAELASGVARRDTLTRLASQLDGEAGSSRDAERVRTLARTIRDLLPRT